MEWIIVSACLLGTNCKYNGQNNLNDELVRVLKNFKVIPICPELFGGLPIPRVPAEIIKDKVINKDGINVTCNYYQGAEVALKLAIEKNVKIAILKAKSPSCGVGQVYDGTFTNTLIAGDGITTQLLKKHGIKVYNETNYQEILE